MTASTPAAHPFARTLIAAMLFLTAAETAVAQQAGSLADEYRLLVALGQNRRDRVAMDRQYMKLTRMAPSDGTMAYTHALLLTDQRKYREAVCSSAQALALDSSNLNAWKLHIWLQLQNEQFAPALKSVAKLANYIPDESASGPRREAGERMAEYFGTVAGYVAFPRRGELPKYDIIEHGRDIRGRMTSSQKASFDRGFGRVRTIALNKAKRIRLEREKAYDADLGSREAQIAQMAAERARIQAELDGLEGLRLEGKALATAERNTLAATRERFVAGSASVAAEDGVSVTHRRTAGLGVGPGGVGVGVSRTRNVNAYDHDYADSSFAAGAKGFGRREYRSVEERDQDYDKYLTKRGDTLLRQLQVLERKEVALRKKPAIGSSGLVARLQRKAKLLTEYMALPVDPQTEVGELLAKLDRYYPTTSVAQVTMP